jgi:hypothetical protein
VSDDKTILAPVEVPGMQITFQSPVGPIGKGINFVMSAAADISSDDLNRRLDVIAAAARRQDAFEQLRLDQQSLAANQKLLAKVRKDRAGAQARLDGRLEIVGGSRRRPVDPTKAAPHDVSAVAQHDQRILEIEGQIAGCLERIPFWQAIIRGEEPIDLDPPTPAMAAE